MSREPWQDAEDTERAERADRLLTRLYEWVLVAIILGLAGIVAWGMLLD